MEVLLDMYEKPFEKVQQKHFIAFTNAQQYSN